jgi:glycosyltransferase involved in cell wall biosynthesis
MTRALVISNLHSPDCFGGYEMVASECMDFLEDEHFWKIECHCANSGRAALASAIYPERVVADLSGYFPRGWTGHHALWGQGREVARATPPIVKKLSRVASTSDVTLLFNPRRLSTLQWVPVLAAAKNPVVWVSDYWPLEYPDCDKFWQAANNEFFSYSPFIMFAAAKMRKLYSGAIPCKADLRPIKRAAFVSDFVLKKNAPALPNLEDAVVIRNGINHSLFPFKEMTPARQNTWGFCGRIQRDKGVFLALEVFANAASRNPQLNFLIAGDLETADGKTLKQKIAQEPLLRERVKLLEKISRERLAEQFYSNVGVLLFPSLWDEPFALTVVEAMACGTFVAATNTGGTGEIVNAQTGLLFSKDAAPADVADAIIAAKPRASACIENARRVAALLSVRKMAADLATFSLAKS